MKQGDPVALRAATRALSPILLLVGAGALARDEAGADFAAGVLFALAFVAHALIGPRRATLFIADGKVPPTLIDALKSDGIDIAPYGQVTAALSALPPDAIVCDIVYTPRRTALLHAAAARGTGRSARRSACSSSPTR